MLERWADALSYSRFRRRVVSDAVGRLLIVGAGTGIDFDHLPPGVTSVVAIEPDPAQRLTAQERARAAGIDAAVVAGVGERLPFADNSFDSVLSVLTLCSVADVPATLREVRRVLRSGGRFVVLEHVRGQGMLGRFQDLIAGRWSRWEDGCLPNRRTREAIVSAGFDTGGLRSRNVWTVLPPTIPHLQGVAYCP